LTLIRPAESPLNRLKILLARQQPLSETSWSAAAGQFVYRRYQAGEYVIEAGQSVSRIGFLVEGLARYYYLTREGKEFNKGFAQPGHPLTSVIALVTGQPSPFYIQALDACECLFLDYEALAALCDQHREWERLARHLLEQLAIKKERREADFLLRSPQERYQQFLKEFEEVADRVPNYHIASYLGITEVALSRIRRRLGLTVLNSG
jgi:CRP-like cAMP-binding protein